ncbi:MAG: hypothetical protein LAQ30_19155 [Acidobacteriia bacterium]|nr:hypothetical protein [Terriglobia bacterium]
MEILTMPVAEVVAEASQGGDEAPPRIEEQEMDILAFELWRRANHTELAAAYEDWLGEEEALRCRASCL